MNNRQNPIARRVGLTFICKNSLSYLIMPQILRRIVFEKFFTTKKYEKIQISLTFFRAFSCYLMTKYSHRKI